MAVLCSTHPGQACIVYTKMQNIPAMRKKFEEFIKKTQSEVCEALEREEQPGHMFIADNWTRETNEVFLLHSVISMTQYLNGHPGQKSWNNLLFAKWQHLQES